VQNVKQDNNSETVDLQAIGISIWCGFDDVIALPTDVFPESVGVDRDSFSRINIKKN
jgi:hypothetical protein